MVSIRVETIITAPPARCFDLARSVSTHELTTKWSRERVVSRHDTDLLELGDFWLRQRLTSVVIEFDRPRFFSDRMTHGAFKSLSHTHQFFKSPGGGTRMVDILEFESPFGLIGRLFDRFVLRAYMERFIRRKGIALKSIAEQQ